MPKVKKILCAVDFSGHSKFVSDYAAYLAKTLEAEVVVVYAAPSLNQYVGFHVPTASIETLVGEIVSGAEKTMDSYLAENFGAVKATGRVVTGYAAEEILGIIDNENIDLVIMGTHGRKGIDRMLFGSVAEKVVKNANVPVLTIRPEE